MKVLCVAEKPSIAKSITQILSGGRWDTRVSGHQYIRNYDFDYNLPPPLGPARGGADFTVTAVLGHLTSSDFDDDHRKWTSCDPFALFDAQIITKVEGNMKQVERNLQNEARNADLLIIWTDCDREGEHIGSEVATVCVRANRRLTVKRARFSAIIPAQIHQACRQANNLDQRQADAVETRIALDLRIGAAFTRLMTMALQTRIPDLSEQVISYGPCQFPTLGFVVDQYSRVQAFIPETFWYIYVAINRVDDDAESEGQDPETRLVEFKWRRNHLFDMEAAIVLFEQCATDPLATVTKVETKPTTKWKPLPLTTVDLQQSGSRLLHLAPKRVLDMAEKLYQKGFLSYPRTETDQYDKDFDFNSLVQKQTVDPTWGGFAQRLVDGEFQTPRNGRKNDKAHPPIHPTAAAVNLDGDEKRVYELVTRRFLASCHRNAEGKTTTVEADIAGEMFSASGLVVLHRNYLEVYPYDKWNGNSLPDFQEGEQFMPDVCDLKEGQTSRPNLLTEADLVGLMDKNGIGTDATIAEHIAKIIEREYVKEKQEARIKYLVPSLLGIGLVEGYNRIGFDRSLSKPQLRAETEYKMQLICDGVRHKREVLDQSVEEYKEVFIRARREFDTIVERVNHYLHGQGEEQDALRAAARGGRGARGAARGAARGGRGAGPRGGRGGGAGGAGGARGRRDEDDDDDDDDDDDEGGGGPAPGGGAVRGRGRGAARGAVARGRGRGRGAAAGGDAPAPRRRTAAPDQDNDTKPGGTPTCQCGTDAVLRTATKSAANHGRQFWTCTKPQGDQCRYFEWADQAGAGSGPAAAGPSRRPRAASPPPAKRQRTGAAAGPGDNSRSSAAVVGDDGCLRCDCDLEANSATVGKEGANKGRRFWSCPSSVMARCKFFAWDDDVEGTPMNVAAPSRANQGSRNAQRTPSGNGGGGGGASGECFKCGQTGHWANACPNEAGPSRSAAPARGGGGRGGASGGGGGGANDECYKCHQTGHWASACPNEDQGGSRSNGGGRGPGPGSRGGGGGGGSKPGECFKCGQAGHWSSDCPNEEGGGGGGGSRTSTRGGRGGSRGRGGASRARGSRRK